MTTETTNETPHGVLPATHLYVAALHLGDLVRSRQTNKHSMCKLSHPRVAAGKHGRSAREACLLSLTCKVLPKSGSDSVPYLAPKYLILGGDPPSLAPPSYHL